MLAVTSTEEKKGKSWQSGASGRLPTEVLASNIRSTSKYAKGCSNHHSNPCLSHIVPSLVPPNQIPANVPRTSSINIAPSCSRLSSFCFLFAATPAGFAIEWCCRPASHWALLECDDYCNAVLWLRKSHFYISLNYPFALATCKMFLARSVSPLYAFSCTCDL